MKAQLHSELLKLRTTRMVAAFLLAVVALTLLTVPVEGFSTELGELTTESMQRTLIGDYGASNAVLLSTFVGLLLVTSEFRYGTIRPTLLFEPRRRVVLAAKLIAAALTGMLLAVVCMALSFGAGLAVLAARDVDVALTGTHTLVLVFGPVAASAAHRHAGRHHRSADPQPGRSHHRRGRLHPRDRSPDLRCGSRRSAGISRDRQTARSARCPTKAFSCRALPPSSWRLGLSPSSPRRPCEADHRDV